MFDFHRNFGNVSCLDAFRVFVFGQISVFEQILVVGRATEISFSTVALLHRARAGAAAAAVVVLENLVD
jgi:hypothetical protein